MYDVILLLFKIFQDEGGGVSTDGYRIVGRRAVLETVNDSVVSDDSVRLGRRLERERERERERESKETELQHNYDRCRTRNHHE